MADSRRDGGRGYRENRDGGRVSHSQYDRDNRSYESGVRNQNPSQKATKKPPKKAAKRKKRRLSPVGLLVIALLLLILGATQYRVETIHIEGDSVLSEEEIRPLLTEPKYTDNTLYFWYYYTYKYAGEIPFVETVEVKLSSPKEVTVTLREKESIGYVVYADARAYFDRSGMVHELSDLVLPGVPLVEGFDLQVVEKGSLLPIDDRNLLQSTISACREICRLQMEVDRLYVDPKGMLTLYIGDIEVSLGRGEHLEDKIALAQVLLEKLQGKKGVLHLEDYDGTKGTRSFRETGDPEENPSDTSPENEEQQESGSAPDTEYPSEEPGEAGELEESTE